MIEVLNIDLPDTVIVLDDVALERIGGRSAVRAGAMRNLLGVIQGIEVETLSSGEASIEVMGSDSMFTASTVLAMPELLARVGVTDAPLGVLVAMPFRFQVALHVIRDAAVVPSLNALVGFAAAGFNEGVGPLTPNVFWWHQGTFERLTSHSADGQVSVQVSPEFQAVLESVLG